MKCSAVQCSAVQCSAVQCSARENKLLPILILIHMHTHIHIHTTQTHTHTHTTQTQHTTHTHNTQHTTHTAHTTHTTHTHAPMGSHLNGCTYLTIAQVCSRLLISGLNRTQSAAVCLFSVICGSPAFKKCAPCMLFEHWLKIGSTLKRFAHSRPKVTTVTQFSAPRPARSKSSDYLKCVTVVTF